MSAAYPTFADAVKAQGAAPTTLVIDTGLAVPADMTVPHTLRLEFIDGGTLDVADGVTLTVDSPVAGWPMTQLFDGDGHVAFGLRSGCSAVCPQWWGYAGDEVSDDSAAVNKALQSGLRSARQLTVALPAGICRANIVFPEPLPFSRDYAVRLKGAGMDATCIRRASEDAPAIAAPATAPDAPNRTICIEDMTVVGFSPGGGKNTITAPVISLDAPRASSVSPRISGGITNVRVAGAAGTAAVPAGETLIDIVGGIHFVLANVETTGGRQALHLKDSSFSYVSNFHAWHNTINGIWIDGGGVHTFIGARVEDGRVEDAFDDVLGEKMTTALRLTNASQCQFFGFSNEGKSAIHAAILIEGTGGQGVSTLNLFHGGAIGGAGAARPGGGARYAILMRGRAEHTKIRDMRIVKSLSPDCVTFGFKGYKGGLPTLNSVGGVLYGDAHGDRPLVVADEGARGNRLRLIDAAAAVQAPLELGTIIAVTGAYTVTMGESGQTFHNATASRPPVVSLPPSVIRGSFVCGCTFSFTAASQPMVLVPSPGESIRGTGPGQPYQLAAGKSLTLRLLVAGTWDIIASH